MSSVGEPVSMLSGGCCENENTNEYRPRRKCRPRPDCDNLGRRMSYPAIRVMLLLGLENNRNKPMMKMIKPNHINDLPQELKKAMKGASSSCQLLA